MQTSLQISIRNIQQSDAVERYVRERAAKLERFCTRITGCHVALEAPYRPKRHGNHYRVRIDLAVPGDELVVSRDQAGKRTHEDLHAAVDAAFDGAQHPELTPDELHGVEASVRAPHFLSTATREAARSGCC